MSKTLEELFKETSEAVKYNYELLEKCANNEYPYDGINEEGHLRGGKNSKAWISLYSTIIAGEQTLLDISKAMTHNINSTKYENVIKYEPIHRCKSCKSLSYINNECVCTNPRMSINEINGEITSNCLMKFDSHRHHYYKINPQLIACRNFKEFSKDFSDKKGII